MGAIPFTSVNGEKCEEKELIQKMYYIENRLVPQLGETQVFRFKEPPYEYLIKHVKVFDQSNPESKNYIDQVIKASNMQQHKNIALIHYYKVERTFSMCTKTLSVETYCNYYAITLREVIEQRKKDDIRFTVGQTWYILKNLVEVSSFLKANSFHYGAYKPQNITLSTQGYIKLYILHLNQGSSTYVSNAVEKTHPYYQALCDRRNIVDYLPFPQEFIGGLRQGNSEFSANYEKQDSFYIGLVIMEMLIDEDIRKYYSINQTTFCSFKRQSLLKDIQKLRSVYGDHLMNLISGMLCEDVQKRLSPTEAVQYIRQHREQLTMSGALRMFEDQNNQIRPKMSYRTSLDIENSLKNLEQNILEAKLTPGPIRTFTKKNCQVSKSSCGVSLTSSKKSTETKDFSNFRERPSQGRASSIRHRVPSVNMKMPR